jgi:hypothetical protein
LTCYAVRKLWAATGWFLEQFQETFHVPEHYLERLHRFRPDSPRYLLRSDRGGTLARRWNLILPEDLTRTGIGCATVAVEDRSWGEI